MEDSVRQRVREVVAYYNTTLSGCTDGDSAMQVKLSRQISHKSAITFDTLSFIRKTFPEVSTVWLMYGEGNMFLSDNQDKVVDDLQEIIAKQTKEIADRDREIAHLNEMLDDKRRVIQFMESEMDMLKERIGDKKEIV